MMHVLYISGNRHDAGCVQHTLSQAAPEIRLSAVMNAQAALAILPTDSEQIINFEVLLVDYDLPDMDGLEFIRLLRKERELDIPVVLMIEQKQYIHADIVRTLYLEVEDYLIKEEGYFSKIPPVLKNARRLAASIRERINAKQENMRFSYLLTASPVVLYSLRFIGDSSQLTWVSENVKRVLGYSPKEMLAPDWWASHLYPDDRESAVARQSLLIAEGKLTHEYRIYHRDGRVIWLLDELQLARDTGERPYEAVGICLDISERKQIELIRQTQQSVLDLMVANQPLSVILSDIATHLEMINPAMLVSILLLDKQTKRLKLGAAPSLPDNYNAAVDGLVIGEGVGSCGTAAFRGEAVIVSDINHHPYWERFLEMTRQADLHACWSLPFKDEKNKVLEPVQNLLSKRARNAS